MGKGGHFDARKQEGRDTVLEIEKEAEERAGFTRDQAILSLMLMFERIWKDFGGKVLLLLNLGEQRSAAEACLERMRLSSMVLCLLLR